MATPSELIRDLYDAFARGDVPAVLGALDPKIRWTEAEGFPYRGTYVGPGAVLTGVFARLASEWEGFSAVPEQFVADGDTVVALGEYRGTYRATRKAMVAPFAHVWRVRGGKVESFRQHVDTVLVQQAMQAE